MPRLAFAHEVNLTPKLKQKSQKQNKAGFRESRNLITNFCLHLAKFKMKKDLFLRSDDNDYKREKLSADVWNKACVMAELLSVNLHNLISSHFLSLLLILLYHREHVA